MSLAGILLLCVRRWGFIRLLHVVGVLGEPQGEAGGSGAVSNPELLATFAGFGAGGRWLRCVFCK